MNAGREPFYREGCGHIVSPCAIAGGSCSLRAKHVEKPEVL